jgi:hypothetical protein
MQGIEELLKMFLFHLRSKSDIRGVSRPFGAIPNPKPGRFIILKP